MDVLWISIRSLFDIHHGDRRRIELWTSYGRLMDVMFCVGGIIIENDLIKKEREIQQKLREIARGERDKGARKVKVGYKKIRVEEKWFRWNEKEEKLMEERTRA